MTENDTTADTRYRVVLLDGNVFWNTDGRSMFTLETARMYARWMGGTVEPIVLPGKTESA
jgi:hypothetical protein